uniref:Envelope glycoprotein n=1 Tax=Seriola dumerili TaxID=41447 RepID=A0A3B4V5F3_SERDU
MDALLSHGQCHVSTGGMVHAIERSLRGSKTPLTLTFIEGQSSAAKFDLCSVIHCGQNQEAHKRSDKYICETSQTGFSYDQWCGYWDYVISNTSPYIWGYRPGGASSGKPLNGRLTLIKGQSSPNCKRDNCNPLLITLKDPQVSDSGLYVLGAYESGTDPLGQFIIKVNKKQESSIPEQLQKNIVTYLDLTNATIMDKVAIETGFVETNEWLRWLIYTAQNNKPNTTNCLACAAARPGLGTVPFPLNQNNDPDGFQCMLRLFNSPNPLKDCTILHYLFPPTAETQPPHFSPYAGNYTCIERRGSGQDVGELSWCNVTLSTNGTGIQDDWLKDQSTPRADVWWFCGGKTLRSMLPYDWKGKCALIQLVMPFYVLPLTDTVASKGMFKSHRIKRRTNPLRSFDTHVYIDEIGVPRGVPDEYKARNQVTAGFESLFFWWVTINKNVDWINYIYYNQQRFVNYTRDGFKGIAEQLEKTSLMAWQNRMALDMLLAEKGGVCKMFGEMCCTFIPNNTAPDGKNAGVDNPFTRMMENWFGRWSGLISSFLVSISVAAALLSVCGCCCIPCLRGLIQRLIDTAITKTMMYQYIPTDIDVDEVDNESIV